MVVHSNQLMGTQVMQVVGSSLAYQQFRHGRAGQ
jgi:hypothetical protein